MKSQKHILVAPLNWGLGHATRCVPIINALLIRGHKVTLASDGSALKLLEKEFPLLPILELPGYNITYAKKGRHFKREMFLQTRHIRRTIKAEHDLINDKIKTLNLDGIISDSRFGLFSNQIPCVILSHQLTVLSGSTTRFSSYLHKRYLNKFTECWVPDFKGEKNLSGLLGHPKKIDQNVRYIGPLSRMRSNPSQKKYDITAILSGPEPQRSMLEEKLMQQLKKYNGHVLLVQGVIGDKMSYNQIKNITTVNFMTTPDLEKAINASDFIISRSGYTTVMDLAALKKKVFFIPTPGQPEQEYLARYFKEKGIAPFVHQDDFKIKDLSKLSVYRGFTSQEKRKDLIDFFGLFERKRKLRTDAKLTLNIDFFLVRFNDMFNNREPQT